MIEQEVREALLGRMRSALSRMEARGHAETGWYAQLLTKYLAVRAGAHFAINPVAHNLIADVGSLVPCTNRRASDGAVIRKRRKKPVD